MSQINSGRTLEYLGNFETLVSLGFTPDDVTYSIEKGGTLFISSAGPEGTQGIYEVSLEGELIQSFPIPLYLGLGYSIARVSNGPQNGHFFLVRYTSLPETQVYEYDGNFNLLNQFSMVGTVHPGDAVAYDSKAKTLMISDCGDSYCTYFELTTIGEQLNIFQGINSTGLTFNDKTGTYFGVDGIRMVEFSTSGIAIHIYDLTQFGIYGAVGIAYGNGELFIADEGRGSEANSIGIIHILKLMK